MRGALRHRGKLPRRQVQRFRVGRVAPARPRSARPSCAGDGDRHAMPVAAGRPGGGRGRRTEADPHWFRGLSYFRIGWNWIKRALEHGDPTVPTPRGHLGLRVSAMSFVSQPSKRGWDKSLPLGIVPALDSLVNRVDRTPRNTSNLSNTQEGDHQVLLTKKSIRIQGLF